MDEYIHYAISLEIRGYDINKDEINSVMNLKCSEFFDENSSMQRGKRIYVRRMKELNKSPHPIF